MKIIKPGVFGGTDAESTYRFECTLCHCVFEAQESEYRREDCGEVSIECPICEMPVLGVKAEYPNE